MAASLGNYDKWARTDSLRVKEHIKRLQQTAKDTILAFDRDVRPLLSATGKLLGTNGDFIITYRLCEIYLPFLDSQYQRYHELSLRADSSHSARELRFVPVAFWYLSFSDKRTVTIFMYWDIVLIQPSRLSVSYRDPKPGGKDINKKAKASRRSLVCTLEKMFPEIRGRLKALYKK